MENIGDMVFSFLHQTIKGRLEVMKHFLQGTETINNQPSFWIGKRLLLISCPSPDRPNPTPLPHPPPTIGSFLPRGRHILPGGPRRWRGDAPVPCRPRSSPGSAWGPGGCRRPECSHRLGCPGPRALYLASPTTSSPGRARRRCRRTEGEKSETFMYIQ